VKFPTGGDEVIPLSPWPGFS